MDANRFDTLTRSLLDVRSRRGTLAALLGGTLGVFGLGETVAKKGKGKKKKRKRKKRKSSPTPAPPCANGMKDGSETDVDCGGDCPRCANGRTCASHNDCAGALCSGGTCQVCASADQCRTDANAGSSCICRPPYLGGSNFCTEGNSTGTTVTSCGLCPPGTICVGPVAGGYNCTKPCGAA